jgi:hypothetical protein
VTLELGGTHNVQMVLNIPLIKEANDGSSSSLAPGDHVLPDSGLDVAGF